MIVLCASWDLGRDDHVSTSESGRAQPGVIPPPSPHQTQSVHRHSQYIHSSNTDHSWQPIGTSMLFTTEHREVVLKKFVVSQFRPLYSWWLGLGTSNSYQKPRVVIIPLNKTKSLILLGVQGVRNTPQGWMWKWTLISLLTMTHQVLIYSFNLNSIKYNIYKIITFLGERIFLKIF